MAIYCIDDGGDGSQTNSTQSASTLDWSKADASVADLIAYDANAFTTNGNIIYFGDDTNDPNKAANWTLTLPADGLPVILISADRTQATPTYKVGTGNQLSSLGGAYTMTIDGAYAMYGMKLASGSSIFFNADSTEQSCTWNCIAAPAANTDVGGSAGSNAKHHNLTIDLSADGTTNRSGTVIKFGLGGVNYVEVHRLSFVNAAYRTGVIFGSEFCYTMYLSNADFSGFTNATACEILDAQKIGNGSRWTFSNCLMAATWTPVSGATLYRNSSVMFSNCGPADDPTYLYLLDGGGTVASSSSIYRTGGATVEGDACSWLITTTTSCSEQIPFYTPWIYGTVSSTGSKTFDLYITNDTADFTDAECWLEIEYLSTSDEAIWALATDQRATITTTAAAQTDDTTSTWNGTGPSFTYKQKLSVTATVNETGQYRARVAVGVASIEGSRYFYVDPKVTVS